MIVMKIIKSGIVVMFYMLLGYCCICNAAFDDRVCSQIKSEVAWADGKLIQSTDIKEWSVFWDKARFFWIDHNSDIVGFYGVLGKDDGVIHVFYDVSSMARIEGKDAGDASVNEKFKSKIREFNKAIGRGLDININTKFIYANMISRLLFTSSYPMAWGAENESLIDPRIWRRSGGGFNIRILHAVESDSISYWLIEAGENGRIDKWHEMVAARTSRPTRSKESGDQ